ncbi:hypothetical protein [Pontibacter chinhatensis]|uniref:Uncharacterized protein n=1 Tax=Pontibacter chinhatensis TaxID=1436961 RepID=A0A1I2ZP63_9BACT|nr:hypothetical protein [Pontibacter chinhatensis]SFH39299.1 hypothetical protein SAMN05421739_11628 [Pontibacter chinhatensis]
MDEPLYYINEAALVIHQNIPVELRKRITLEEIVEIIESMFEYMEEVNIARSSNSIVDISIEVPAHLDEMDMKISIIGKCTSKDIFLSLEDISAVLDAEMRYLEQKGMLDDSEGLGMYSN